MVDSADLVEQIRVDGRAFFFPGGVIDIPHDFDGPETALRNSGAVVFSFARDYEDAASGSLVVGRSARLEVIVQAADRDLGALARAEAEVLLADHLRAELKRLDRPRREFESTEPEAIEVADAPGLEAEWTGTLMGEPMAGNVRVYVQDSKVVRLSVQDFVELAGDHTAAARSSIQAAVGD